VDISELATVLIFTAQQLGVILGVGAQTILLVQHLIELHEEEATRPRGSATPAGARKARGAGIFLIVFSGAAAVGLHLTGGMTGILLEPAFLFKWALIAALVLLHVFEKRLPPLLGIMEGFAGANWYALFLVHTLAPVTNWASLLALYAAWMGLFGLLWSGFTMLMHGAKPRAQKIISASIKSSPKPPLSVPPRPPPLKPVPPPPRAKYTPPPPPPHPKPEPPRNLPVLQHIMIAKPEPVILNDKSRDNSSLPAIRVMPKTPEEISKQYRGSAVHLNQ